jgi:lysophospholipase L1-like esterase
MNVSRKLTLSFVLIVLAICIVSVFASKHYSIVSKTAEPTATLDFMNHRPIPPDAYRVLFIGDSITLSFGSPHIWDHVSGMAATTPERDFVHLTVARLQSELSPRPVESVYALGAGGKIGGMLSYLRSQSGWTPDLVILQGGENDKFNTDFRETYSALISASPHTIVLGDWWDDEKSEYERAEAAKRGLPFVELRPIQRNSANWGYGGPFNAAAVANHPNDSGMKLIAQAIAEAQTKHGP